MGSRPGLPGRERATDIAFAVAVLTIFGRRLPTVLRAFLLTLAVVDDFLGIVVIAIFYADDLKFAWLGAAFLTIALFAVLARRRGMTAWVLVPLAIAAWGFMHASGIQATITGVILGFAVPALARGDERTSTSSTFGAPSQRALPSRSLPCSQPVSA